MEAVAAELGCSGQALGRRFGSKRGLVHAYLTWLLEQIADRFRIYRELPGSPLESLRARCLIPVEERPEELLDPVDATRRANMDTFWAAVRADPELRALAARSTHDSEREAGELLRAAQAAGEIYGSDPDELGRTLIAAWVGTNNLWDPTTAVRTLPEQLAVVFDTLIEPYKRRPNHG